MILKDLVSTFPQPFKVNGVIDCLINGLSCDSRKVSPGDLFFALRGGQEHDRHEFVGHAVERGAVALVVEEPVCFEVPQVIVRDSRACLSHIAQMWYGDPAEKLINIGITGTNGKTTTAYLLYRLLELLGSPCGYLGTLGLYAGDSIRAVGNTTPEADVLHRSLKSMVDAGKKFSSLEVSSHGLSLGRVDNIRFSVGVFTNFSRDHIDFHNSMDKYFEAKAILFDQLDKDSVAVLNFDDEKSQLLAERTEARVIKYGQSSVADFRLEQSEIKVDGMKLNVVTPDGLYSFSTKLTGAFNCDNILAVLSAGYGLGFNIEVMCEAISKIEVVPGRFEKIDLGQDFHIVVDYAHTPDALKKLLNSVQAITTERVLCVFGCGGDRDPGKRAPMGQTVDEFSDIAWVTSDNPRTENPQKIIDEIIAGFKDSTQFKIQLDRVKAIHEALSEARSGDWVVIAGKGHESEQVLAQGVVELDDRLVAKNFLYSSVRSTSN
ncbi:MAG: UDP-N-acetylmuramoyl-L-alanyl-D-glutamate--2,6-diaminopimelate ligase [Candidatus Latescibacterota bacterium]|nr:UDP-N-acetylmuramoyl-L-alanyl-D-glutamate--2,6-diaminopimelate ligase [Candidatus Latescibacterota bacterium]